MNNAKEKLLREIDKAIFKNEKFSKYKKYPPIVNSRKMLLSIKELIGNKSDIFLERQAELNIGLLAAKSLDFDSNFQGYATLLHHLWGSVNHYFKSPKKYKICRIKCVHKQCIAYRFYQNQGYNNKQKIFDHLDGIDFNKDVDDCFLIDKESSICQWKLQIMPKGDYYTDKRHSHIHKDGNPPSCVGVNPKQSDYNGNELNRIEHTIAIKEKVIVLKSTAAGVIDSWSTAFAYKTNGGCVQYFNAQIKNQII